MNAPGTPTGGRNRKVYGAYVILLLSVLTLARFPTHAFMRYSFMGSLIVFFAFTGALPYLVTPIAKGEPGWMRQAFTKIAFPLLAIFGIVLVVMLLIKVGS